MAEVLPGHFKPRSLVTTALGQRHGWVHYDPPRDERLAHAARAPGAAFSAGPISTPMRLTSLALIFAVGRAAALGAELAADATAGGWTCGPGVRRSHERTERLLLRPCRRVAEPWESITDCAGPARRTPSRSISVTAPVTSPLCLR